MSLWALAKQRARELHFGENISGYLAHLVRVEAGVASAITPVSPGSIPVERDARFGPFEASYQLVTSPAPPGKKASKSRRAAGTR